MKYLNLGILAHVDAGKTTLTERLLFNGGVIDAMGSVDTGNTQTDSLDLERQRGITIRSAVATFCIDDLHVNLIDTPGHPDFIAEVERVLNVLDAVVLVISAVEGVQAQTRVLMLTLQRLGIPTLIFVNKIDRRGAQYESLLEDIAAKLTPAIATAQRVTNIGSSLASVVIDTATTIDAEHPVLFGSAVTGAGISELVAAIKRTFVPSQQNPHAPPHAQVFKVEQQAAGGRVAYIRMFAGTLRVRDRLPNGKITGIDVFDNGTIRSQREVFAGQVAKVRGLDVSVGDVIGEATNDTSANFSPPSLETIISASNPLQKPDLLAALTQLAEQDPLINLRQNDERGEISVTLYGEVQKEVIEDALVNGYGIAVEFSPTTVVCIERPIGIGEAVELKAPVGNENKSPDATRNPFLATVGLRVEPTTIGSGIRYTVDKHVLGTMSPAFFRAIEESVHATLKQGLYGWEVTDINITLTHTGYWPRQSAMHAKFDKSVSSTARDFRLLTPTVLLDALHAAGSAVCEPIHSFVLELPTDAVNDVLIALGRFDAVPFETKQSKIAENSVLLGEIPIARLSEFQRSIPALTNGEGFLESSFDRYQRVRGTIPKRQRIGPDPRNRQQYFRCRE